MELDIKDKLLELATLAFVSSYHNGCLGRLINNIHWMNK